MMMPTNELLRPKDAWELLRISRANFFARVRDGRLPPPSIKIGRLPRWSKNELIRSVLNISNNSEDGI